jgi:AraC-like DNA-binding protein
MNKNYAKDFEKYIDETLEVQYLASSVKYVDYPFEGSWINFAGPAFAQIENGEAETIFRDSGMVLHRPAGYACFLPAGTWRKTRLLSHGGGLFRWSRVNFSVFHGVDLLSFYNVPELFPLKSSRKIGDISEELFKLENDNQMAMFERSATRKELCYGLLNIVLCNSELKDNALENFHELTRLEAVISYIDKHYNQNIDIEELAGLACLSRSRFHRKFRQILGIAPMEYVKRRRLKEARRLLQQTELSIAETGERVGWSDQFHFSRVFKSATGMSPAGYRRGYHEKFDTLFGGV